MFSSRSSFPSSSNHFQRDFDRFSAETLVTRETKVSRESRETRHGYHGIDTCCRRNLQRVERLFDRAISTFSTIQSRCVYIYIYALPGYLSVHREWKVYEPEEYTTSVSKFARFLFNFHACIEHVSSAHLPLEFESENFCSLSDWQMDLSVSFPVSGIGYCTFWDAIFFYLEQGNTLCKYISREKGY